MNAEEREHALALAEELLADIELDRCPVDKQVLRATRLARLVGDEKVSEWLLRERLGYYKDDTDLDFFKLTGRRASEPEDHVFAGAAVLGPAIRTLEGQLAAARVPDVSGEYATIALRESRKHIQDLGAQVIKFGVIQSKVSALLHDFALRQFHTLRFSTRQDSMFERAKSEIDRLLSELSSDALQRIDAAYANLRMGDPEAIAAAMNSVRRLVDAFADAVFPASTEVRTDGQGNSVRLGEQQRLNRIKAFIDDNAHGDSRAKRLKRAVTDIYDRVSTGVHSDVTTAEAEYLFLSTYVLLGEVLALPGRTREPTANVDVS